jgi:hypothetical protein
MDKEITKAEFKRLYFKYATKYGGWTKEYWDRHFEKEESKKYFFTAPNSPDQTRMFINSDSKGHRIFLLSEEAEEAFFEFPTCD